MSQSDDIVDNYANDILPTYNMLNVLNMLLEPRRQVYEFQVHALQEMEKVQFRLLQLLY